MAFAGHLYFIAFTYSNVPNKRTDQNKHAGLNFNMNYIRMQSGISVQGGILNKILKKCREKTGSFIYNNTKRLY